MPMIEIRDVSKWYGSFQVLKDCSTGVEKGEVIVVCGPSGSGKSTLIKAVNALEPIQKGEITVDAEVCGRGPVQLAAVGIGDEQRKVYSKPVRFILPETADLRTLPSLPTGR